MLVDIVSTYHALQNSFIREGNPFLSDIINKNFILVSIIKIIVSGGIILFYSKINKSYSGIASAGMKIILFMMLIVVMNNIFVISTSAESGTVQISNGYITKSYSQSQENFALATSHWGTLTVDLSSINEIQAIAFHPGAFTTWGGQAYGSTTFTITSGGTGTGTFNFVQSANTINYLFDPGAKITSTTVVLSFSNNAVPGALNNPKIGTSVPITNQHVVFIEGQSGGNYGQISGAYDVIVLYSGVDRYNVSYPSPHIFRLDYNKSIASKLFVYTIGNIYLGGDNQYTISNMSNMTFSNLGGIKLVTSLSNGYNITTIINTSTCTVCSYAGSGNISYQYDNYSLNDLARVSYDLKNPIFGSYVYQIVEYTPSGLYNQYDVGIVYPYAYNIYFGVEEVGFYKVKLIYYPIGDWGNVFVLAESTMVCCGVNPNQPVLTPNINKIKWWQNAYSVGDTGKISYQFAPDTFSLFSLSYPLIKIYKDGEIITAYDGLNTNSGVINYTFSSAGSYRAELVRKDLLQDTFLDLDTVPVTNPSLSSSIAINSPVIAGKSFDAAYQFNYAVSLQGELNSVILEKYNSGVWEAYKTVSLNNNNIISSTPYTVSLTVGSPGTYKATIYDISRGKQAYTQFTAVSGFIPPTSNISSSYIYVNRNNGTYFYNDLVTITWGIANTNFSDGGQQKYITIYNNDENKYLLGTFADFAYETLDQTGNLKLSVVSGGNEQSCSGCYLNNAQFLPGNNSAILMSKNFTTGKITQLAYSNFTVARVSSEGYGMYIHPTELRIKEFTEIEAYAPGNATITVYWNSKTVTQQLLNTINFNNSIAFQDKFGFEGTYTYSLLAPDGSVKFRTNVYVNSSVAIPQPSPPPLPLGDINTPLEIFASPWFWTAVICVVFLIAGGVVAGVIGAVGGLAVAVVFCAVGSLIPTWALFVFVIVIIILCALVLTGSSANGGGK